MTDRQLPLFQNERPQKLDVKLSGSAEFDEALATSADLDETVFLVIEATVGNVGHHRDADRVLHRTQALKVVSLAVLPDSHIGVQWLVDQHRAVREAAGIHELPLEGDREMADA